MRHLGASLLALAIFVGSAHVFEARGFEASSGAVAKPAPEIAAGQGLALESGDKAVGSKARPQFSLPGIGNLGVLPKLDFGLELLYGGPPARSRDIERKDLETDPEDLTIRGTFKHRF